MTVLYLNMIMSQFYWIIHCLFHLKKNEFYFIHLRKMYNFIKLCILEFCFISVLLSGLFKDLIGPFLMLSKVSGDLLTDSVSFTISAILIEVFSCSCCIKCSSSSFSSSPCSSSSFDLASNVSSSS